MQIKKGVNAYFIMSNKFKDIGISVRFRYSLEQKSAASRTLLALMMMDRCKKYDTKKKMTDAQDNLYGATLGAQTMGFGKSHVLEIRTKIINPTYVSEEHSLFEGIFKFLNEIVFFPLFKQEIFEENKDILLSKIKRMEDDPQQYIVTCGLNEIGKNTSLGISTLGTYDDVKNLTLQDIIDAYQEMIDENIIDIIMCGDFDENEATSYIQQYLPFNDRIQDYPSFYSVKNNESEKMVKLYKNISQSYIMMVWFTNTSIVDQDYYALRLANGILGQFSTSFLFQEVREKRSLCYSIYSNLISYDGALGVTTGVEQKDIEESIQLIKEQFNRVVEGDFDQQLLDTTKRLIISSLKSSRDNMNSLMAFTYQNILLGRNCEIQDIIKCIEGITKENVIDAISKCTYKGTVLLCKEDANEQNI